MFVASAAAECCHVYLLSKTSPLLANSLLQPLLQPPCSSIWEINRFHTLLLFQAAAGCLSPAQAAHCMLHRWCASLLLPPTSPVFAVYWVSRSCSMGRPLDLAASFRVCRDWRALTVARALRGQTGRKQYLGRHKCSMPFVQSYVLGTGIMECRQASSFPEHEQVLPQSLLCSFSLLMLGDVHGSIDCSCPCCSNRCACMPSLTC
jgi:hypothetical protein